MSWRRFVQLLFGLLMVVLFGGASPGLAHAVPASSSYDAVGHTYNPVGEGAYYGTGAAARDAIGLGVGEARHAASSTPSRVHSARFVPSDVAAKSFATGADEAVFWSGVGRGGDKIAAQWVAKNGGATLETTMASRGITLPAWDASNPAVVSAWRDASAQFARGARAC